MALVVKNPLPNARDTRDAGLILGLGRFPGGEHGNPLQYSCLENPMHRRTWWATVPRVAKSRTQLKWLSMHSWDIYTWSLHVVSLHVCRLVWTSSQHICECLEPYPKTTRWNSTVFWWSLDWDSHKYLLRFEGQGHKLQLSMGGVLRSHCKKSTQSMRYCFSPFWKILSLRIYVYTWKGNFLIECKELTDTWELSFTVWQLKIKFFPLQLPTKHKYPVWNS